MKMNIKYLIELDAIIKQAQKDALREVSDRLQQRLKQIDCILTNGRPIYEMMDGDWFERMHTHRMNLIAKMMTLAQVERLIHEIMYEK